MTTIITDETDHTIPQFPLRSFYLPSPARKRVAKALGVSLSTLSYALSYDARKGTSETARRVRYAALKMGGRKLLTLPEIETIHDHDGHMLQRYPKGTVLDVEKATGLCVLLRSKGKPVELGRVKAISELEEVQRQAAAYDKKYGRFE